MPSGDYVSKVTTLVNRLLASGRQVRLLIGDKGDIEAARDILEQLAPAEANKVAFEPSASLHELMQQIAGIDVVIAKSRYHNIVCALAMGRPTISTAYASKNDALLHDTGLAAFCHRIDSLILKQSSPRSTLLSSIERFDTQVKAGVERYRSRLARQEELLHTTFLDNVRSTADPAVQSLRPN